jgi:AraC-like DNA-binding protein
MNILDIALYIGFDSVKTFNRAFKKFTGKNPSDYRK